MESGLNKNGWVMPPEVLGANVNKFAGVPCQVDHHWFSTLEKFAGTHQDPYFQDDAVLATLRLADTDASQLLQKIFDAWLEDKDAGLDVAPIGLSAVLWIKWTYNYDTEKWIAADIIKVESADAVLHPAAGGQVQRVLSSIQSQGEIPPPQTRSSIMTQIATDTGENVQNTNPPPNSEQQDDTQAAPNLSQILTAINTNTAQINALGTQVAQLVSQPEPQSEPESQPEPDPQSEPQPYSNIIAQIAEINANIEHLTTCLAEQEAEHTIEGMGQPPHISMGPTGLEQVTLALDSMLSGVRPPDSIRPLNGIRELYHLLSGDFEMTGLFDAERVYLANVTSATMAKLTADALNKRVVNEFQQYPRWWESIVSPEDFTSLQDVKWITLGGIGELPTIPEGQAYTEMAWDDIEQQSTFIKKGGYLGLTLEAIDKDDTRRLQSAPRALAQGAWLTLSKSISNIFTANSGVGPDVYYDDTNTRALFHASNGNLGSSAFSWAAWVATRTAMRQQTEHNSNERLGALTAPYYALVPSDIEMTAIQTLASAGEPGTADNDINPEAQGEGREERLRRARERVIVVDLWTNTNNWAAIANHKLYPTIGLGFRFGRMPEVFAVASPTAGLMFTNDVMPVKVRFFFATGPMDYRGLYKHNI